MSLSYATALPVGPSNSRVSSTFQTMWSDLSSLDGPDFVQRGFCEQLCQSDDSGLLIFYASSTSFPKNVSLRTFALYQGTSFASFHTQVFLTVSNVWRGFFSVFPDIWCHVGFPWKGINVSQTLIGFWGSWLLDRSWTAGALVTWHCRQNWQEEKVISHHLWQFFSFFLPAISSCDKGSRGFKTSVTRWWEQRIHAPQVAWFSDQELGKGQCSKFSDRPQPIFKSLTCKPQPAAPRDQTIDCEPLSVWRCVWRPRLSETECAILSDSPLFVRAEHVTLRSVRTPSGDWWLLHAKRTSWTISVEICSRPRLDQRNSKPHTVYLGRCRKVVTPCLWFLSFSGWLQRPLNSNP